MGKDELLSDAVLRSAIQLQQHADSNPSQQRTTSTQPPTGAHATAHVHQEQGTDTAAADSDSAEASSSAAQAMSQVGEGGSSLRLDIGAVQYLLTHHSDDGVRQQAYEAGVAMRCSKALAGWDVLHKQRLKLARYVYRDPELGTAHIVCDVVR